MWAGDTDQSAVDWQHRLLLDARLTPPLPSTQPTTPLDSTDMGTMDWLNPPFPLQMASSGKTSGDVLRYVHVSLLHVLCAHNQTLTHSKRSLAANQTTPTRRSHTVVCLCLLHTLRGSCAVT